MPRRNKLMRKRWVKRPHTNGGGKRWRWPTPAAIRRLERDEIRLRGRYVENITR